MNDRTFRKIFTALTTAIVMLVFVLSMHLFIGEPLNSTRLWLGSLMVYISINLITDVKGIVTKLGILVGSVIAMTFFFKIMLDWSLKPSLYGGAIILIVSILLYMSFVE